MYVIFSYGSYLKGIIKPIDEMSQDTVNGVGHLAKSSPVTDAKVTVVDKDEVTVKDVD